MQRDLARLITENERLRERIVLYERTFDEREKELLDEISRLANELAQLLSIQGDRAPASIRKTVQNVKLKSQLRYNRNYFRNKDQVMNQMIEVMKQSKMKPHMLK